MAGYGAQLRALQSALEARLSPAWHSATNQVQVTPQFMHSAQRPAPPDAYSANTVGANGSATIHGGHRHCHLPLCRTRCHP
jgi:hypothetical protein